MAGVTPTGRGVAFRCFTRHPARRNAQEIRVQARHHFGEGRVIAAAPSMKQLQALAGVAIVLAGWPHMRSWRRAAQGAGITG